MPTWSVASTAVSEPVTSLVPAYRVQSLETAVPPLSVVTSFFSNSDGASSSLTNVHITVSPMSILTVATVPVALSQTMDVFV